MINKNLIEWYKRSRFLTTLIVSILVPIYVIIILSLLSIFIENTEYGMKFIIFNSPHILFVTSPLLIFIQILLGQSNSGR